MKGSKRLKRNFLAKVVAGRRITIPQEICHVLEIKEGDFVDVDVGKVKANLKEGN
jgi:bifunctional DNA-binding transcriptional regulator/antitoxin component of YhaV-PrlF toxin-antitoxin module